MPEPVGWLQGAPAPGPAQPAAATHGRKQSVALLEFGQHLRAAGNAPSLDCRLPESGLPVHLAQKLLHYQPSPAHFQARRLLFVVFGATPQAAAPSPALPPVAPSPP